MKIRKSFEEFENNFISYVKYMKFAEFIYGEVFPLKKPGFLISDNNCRILAYTIRRYFSVRDSVS